jgi:pimeloyl-ACP methyl ester carboxylesterase
VPRKKLTISILGWRVADLELCKNSAVIWQLSKTFDFQGQVVRYDIQGQGEPVVLVHGTPWSSFCWRNLIPHLAKSWKVFYFDLLGYGQSEKRDGQDVSLAVQNKLFTALLDFWELESSRVIGHDFGGTTVLRTHLLNKHDFHKMILIDPVALAPWGSEFFTHVNKHEAVFAEIPDYIHEAMVTAYVKGAMYSPMPKETLQGILDPWLGETGRRAFYRQIAQANQRYTDEIQPLYPTIKCPVLLIWGQEDTWIPIAKGLELYRLLPNAQFSPVANAGHLVQEDTLNVLIEAIDRFLL